MNPHGLPHWILSPARLPVSPLSRHIFLRLYYDPSVPDWATVPNTLPSMNRSQLGGPFLQHRRVDDGVPPIEGGGCILLRGVGEPAFRRDARLAQLEQAQRQLYEPRRSPRP